MKRFMALILAVCFLGACGGEPTPAPDLVATQIAVEEAAHATMTAKAPTATPRPAETSTPTLSDLWETWESTALGFSVDYPATCEVSKNATGWQRFVDSGKWGMSVTVRNKAA